MKIGKKKYNYYNIETILKNYPDAFYYVVFGERSNGKTYSALSHALKKYAKTGEQFAYLRRWNEDIKPKHLSSLFAGHAENKFISDVTNGQWSTVNYTSGKFYLARYDNDKGLVRSEEPCGYAFDLNSMEHSKGNSYPKVTTVIFDEFMSRSGYIPNEWILFVNTISTIVRLRDNVKIILLGNTVNKVCPYFSEMGLVHIKDQKPGTVDVYRYGDSDLQVVCEYTESSAKRGGKASDVYFAFDNPELKMITSGAWEIAIYPHLDRKILPKEIVTNFFIDYENEILHGEVVVKPDGAFVFLHGKTTPIKDENTDIVYTDKPSEKWNYRMAMTKHRDKLTLFILQCLRENRVFYSTNEIGEVFRNYVMWSDSFSIKN